MISRSALQRMFAGALALGLTACAGLPPTPGEQSPRPHTPATERVFYETVDISGRLSVRYQGRQQEEAVHGSFIWAQTPARTAVTLLSPLGQTVAVIEATPQRATLTQAGQAPRTETDVDTLTANALGWPLPIAGLRDWLQGFAIDHAGHPFIAAPNAENVVTRDGWRIRYANWQSDPSSVLRPKRIDLARFTDQAGDVSIRIVIDSWQLH
jgi:outer membrane lipoprotein LolB